MPISSLRWRAASVLIAAGAAAAAALALAVPAGASTGTAEISPEQAGYTATGAQFKSITASVYLRNPAQYAGEVASFGHSVQLWSSDSVAIVGVTASTSGGGYTPYAIVYNRSTHQVIASNPQAAWCLPDDNCSSTIGSFAAGATVRLNVGFYPKLGFLNITVTLANGDPWPYFIAGYTIGTGESFTQARVGTDFGSTPWDASYTHTPPASYVKIAAYGDATLTTYSGHTSTFWSWWIHHKLLANTEQQSAADLVAIPADLTSGGANFQTWFVPQAAQGPDQPAPQAGPPGT